MIYLHHYNRGTPLDTADFPGGSVVKNPLASVGDAGDLGSVPGLWRFPGGGNGNPLQYSCLEHPMDRGVWWATVHRVAKSQMWMSDWKKSESEVTQSCLTLCDPMDCSPPGSSTHGTFQARVLEWIAISFSRGSSQPRDRTRVSCTVGRCFTVWATRKDEWLSTLQY